MDDLECFCGPLVWFRLAVVSLLMNESGGWSNETGLRLALPNSDGWFEHSPSTNLIPNGGCVLACDARGQGIRRSVMKALGFPSRNASGHVEISGNVASGMNS